MRDRYALVCVERIAQVQDVLRRPGGCISAVILEARDADGVSAAPLLRTLHDAMPATPILAYCVAGAEHAEDIRLLAMAGAHALVFRGRDDTGIALRATLDFARQASIGEVVSAALTPLFPSRLAPLIRYVATHTSTATSVDTVARALGHHRKTLVNQCRRAGAPPPHELLVWCRLSVVAYLLSTTTKTIEGLALELEFASDTALRNLFKRYLGTRATEVRARGGLPFVLIALRRRLAISDAENQVGAALA